MQPPDATAAPPPVPPPTLAGSESGSTSQQPLPPLAPEPASAAATAGKEQAIGAHGSNGDGVGESGAGFQDGRGWGDNEEGEEQDVDDGRGADEPPLGVTRCVFMTLHHPNYSPLAKLIAMSMGSIIVVSCITFVMGTMPRFEYEPPTCAHPACVPGPASNCTRIICHPVPVPALRRVEVGTIVIFTVEYLVRMLTVHAVPQRLIYPSAFIAGKLGMEEPSGLMKTLKYAYQGMNVIDFLAVLPFYLSLWKDVGEADLVFLRLLRLVRVLRIFKLGRYTAGSELLTATIRASSSALGLLIFFMSVLTLLFASIIYFAEEGTFKVTPEYPNGAYFRKTITGNGEEVSPFSSIPVAAYYVAMTATTVGYGEYTAVSMTGRIMAVLVAYLGIIGIALPSTIIGKHFYETYFKVIDTRKEERMMLIKDREDHGAGPVIKSTKDRAVHFFTDCTACCRRSRRAGQEGASGQHGEGAGAGARVRSFFLERRDTLGKMVADRERELERELEMAELETWGALNADSLPKPPQGGPSHQPSYLWHHHQQRHLGGGDSAVSPLGSGLASPPLLSAATSAAGGESGTGLSTPPLQPPPQGQQQPPPPHSVVMVEPSPHRPSTSGHAYASSRASSRASSPGPSRHEPYHPHAAHGHHGPGGGSGASVASTSSAAAKRRDKHHKMKELTRAVREQLSQIASLAERLEEMEGVTMRLMDKLEELEEDVY